MRRGIIFGAAAVCAAGAIAGTSLTAGASQEPDRSGTLLVSGARFVPDFRLIAGQTQLPPGCVSGCVTATAGGTYPQIFNNALQDGSFGITAPIFIDELTPDGRPAGHLTVPARDIVTSFSSKSELSLNVTPDGGVSFMGYVARPATLDVSNSNTLGVVDPTNPVPASYDRAVAVLTGNHKLQLTETNAYSGNNGRAAIVADVNGQQVIYTAGNAGNGGTPQPAGIILGAGAQIMQPGAAPGTPTPVGSFNITELGDKPDKVGKDDNFRGLAMYHNVLYYTKGSGGNGVNTVYFLDTTGKACPGGVGLPDPDATLPTTPLSYNPATLPTAGLPSNMCVLKGFPTALKSATSFPFGPWFANPTTLYVADEGSGTATFANGEYTAAAASATAGLQKWVFDSEAGEWKLAYTLQTGLNLGQPYSVAGYPSGTNPATGMPWSPATDGLRTIAGRVNSDGTVTIWAVTSTVSGSGDQGADPNKLVEITDSPASTSAGSAEAFTTLRSAGFGEVLRGVAFTPAH